MSKSANAPLTANLIAVKGEAKPITQMATRAAEIDAPALTAQPIPPAPKAKSAKEPEQPLNFSVPASWKKRFAQAALNEDKKHKEFLFWLFEQYEKRTYRE